MTLQEGGLRFEDNITNEDDLKDIDNIKNEERMKLFINSLF